MHLVIGASIFFIAVVFGTVFLIVFAILMVSRAVFRGLFGFTPRQGVRQPAALPQSMPVSPSWAIRPPPLAVNEARAMLECRHPGCREVNPTEARFCRRCGRSVSMNTNNASNPALYTAPAPAHPLEVSSRAAG